MSDSSSSDLTIHDSSNSTSCLVGEIAFSVMKGALLIPLYVYILYLGLQQRRQETLKTATHSDVFTYHVAAFELTWFLASVFDAFGADVPTPFSDNVMYLFFCISWYGESFFHVLTCVERYLAVVHPIVYMRLRNARGVRIRNISIVSVWVLSPVCTSFHVLYSNPVLPPILIPMSFILVSVSFCSLSVLYVLVRPGPGDGGQDRRQVDPAKQRAFYTITAISVVLWLWFGGFLTIYALDTSLIVSDHTKCGVKMFAFMLNLPSSAVLPLLYLHRMGKPSQCFCKSG